MNIIAIHLYLVFQTLVSNAGLYKLRRVRWRDEHVLCIWPLSDLFSRSHRYRSACLAKLPPSNVSKTAMPQTPHSRETLPHTTLKPIPTFETAGTLSSHRRGKVTRAERRAAAKTLDAGEPLIAQSFGQVDDS